MGGSYEILLPNETINVNKQISKAKTMPEIEAILKKFEEDYQDKEPKEKSRMFRAIARNTMVAKGIKQLANFRCQVCGSFGFEKAAGGLYARVHHKEELAKSGLDVPSNIICMCPTCHRVIHYGSDEELER